MPAVDVLTQHNNAARTGANLNEVVLTPSSVRSGQFHRLFHWLVDGQQYAQPLYLSDVSYKGRVIDMVVVATMKNVVEAFEVPPPGSITPGPALWIVDSTTIGAPLRYDFKFMGLGPVVLGHNISPWIGITSTPVIDRELGLIYVCAKAKDHTTGEATHYLVSIDLAGKVRKIARIPDMAPSRFTGGQQLQRPALLEANHRIYVAFGAHEDFEPYHGWVFAYDAESLEQKAFFCTTCGDRHSHGGGIWQAGGGLAADAAGDVYLATGNGTYEEGKGTDVGSSFLRFGPNLELLGSWTPPNWACQNMTDSDLGSAGPLFDARTSTLVGGGKEGVLYALRPHALSGRNVGAIDPSAPSGKPCRSATRPARTGPGYSSLQASPKYKPVWMMDLVRWFDPAGQMFGYQHIHGSPVSWQVTGESRRLVYLSAERDYLRAFALDGEGVLDGSDPGTDPKSLFRSKCQNSMQGMPGGALSLSAHGGDPESGIVWVSMPKWNRDALHHVVPGVLRAYRAYPGADGQLTEIWNSERETDIAEDCASSGRHGHSDVGLFAKGAAPTVARGRVYLGTFSNELVAYGLAPRVAAARNVQAPRPTLEVASVPAEVAPSSPVTISVTITNGGDAPWRQGEGRRLSCDDPSRNETLQAEPVALQLDGMAAHKALATKVTLIAPAEEGTHEVRCRIAPPDGLRAGSGSDLDETSTAYVSLNVLRPECAGLRARRDALYAQFKPDVGFPARLQPDIERLKTEAAKRGCYLGTEHHLSMP